MIFSPLSASLGLELSPVEDSSGVRVNQNVEPLPSSLSRPILPPISSTSLLEMASPRPVPPYWRAVEASAWLKALNSDCCWARDRPTPESRSEEHTSELQSR